MSRNSETVVIGYCLQAIITGSYVAAFDRETGGTVLTAHFHDAARWDTPTDLIRELRALPAVASDYQDSMRIVALDRQTVTKVTHTTTPRKIGA